MRHVGVWFVPALLLALGVVLIWIGGLVYADAITNTAYVNAHNCPGQAGCASLACLPECGYAGLITVIGVISAAAGVAVGCVRFVRRVRRAPRGHPAGVDRP